MDLIIKKTVDSVTIPMEELKKTEAYNLELIRKDLQKKMNGLQED